jgi:ABC-type dipeptide/oligopeptide/nickel transport system ATPase subunit
MIKPDTGKVYFEGADYTGKGPGETGKFLQMIFQDAKSSFDPRMTMVKSILESGRGKTDKKAIAELIKTVGLEEELLTRKPADLSGGQCQRMSIARAFYSGARILLCDEITSALDVSSQAQVIDIMRQLKNAGKLSALFVSHDIALVSMICDRIMIMKDGRCVEQGVAADVIKKPENEYTKLLLESAIKQAI